MLVAIVAAMTAFGYSMTQPRLYESVVNVLGTTAKPDEGLNNAIKAEVRRFPSILTSNTIAQKIDERGKFDLGADAISAKIKPLPLPDSYMLKITVSDTDRFRAANIANTAADILKEDNLAKQATVPDDSKIFFEKISPAPVPDVPSTPRTSLNTGAGFALGLVLGLILIFVIDFFDDSLKTEEDVERYTGLKVIGVVPPWRGLPSGSARSNHLIPNVAADASDPSEAEEPDRERRRKGSKPS
jgi:capsular polysaccharide biosynthesis protein